MVHSVLMTQVELPLFYASSIVSIGCWVSAGSHSYFPLSSPQDQGKGYSSLGLTWVCTRENVLYSNWVPGSQPVSPPDDGDGSQPVSPPDDGDGSPASQASR